MRRKTRKSDWVSDISRLTQLYLHDSDVRTLVDAVAKNPEVFWSWPNRAFPLRVRESAGELADLLIETDPIVLSSSRHFTKVSYTYYPAQFLLDYREELLAGAAAR